VKQAWRWTSLAPTQTVARAFFTSLLFTSLPPGGWVGDHLPGARYNHGSAMSSDLHAPRPTRSDWLARVALVGLAVALAFLSVHHFLARRAEDREVQDLLKTTGLDQRQPDLAYTATYDPDPVRARLAIARALLAESFDFSSFSRLPQREAIEEASRVPERLELARELAVSTLKVRPASWQAAMIIGGATYRLWWLRGDLRLVSDRSAWEKPLRAAMAMAPNEDEPARVLAMAYVETWRSLSPAEQAEDRDVLRRAFRDPPTFNLIASTWLEVAKNLHDALGVVPDTVETWTTVQSILGRKEDWPDVVDVARRRASALSRTLDAKLDELVARLRGGDSDGARTVALWIIDSAPPDGRWAEKVERAVELLPPVLPDPGSLSAFSAWLDWGLDGFVRGQQWLKPVVVRRLAGALEDLPRPRRALAALAAGDLVGAEILERESEALNTEPWAPYCIAKARVLLARGELQGARRILALTQPLWRGTVPELLVRRNLAVAMRDGQGAAEAEAALDRLASGSWPATWWRWRGDVPSMDIIANGDAPGLQIVFDITPEHGGVVEVSLDGSSVALLPLPEHGPMTVAVPITAGPHLVAVSPVAGGRSVPGTVTLLGGQAATPN
jgi:hypothetical protein